MFLRFVGVIFVLVSSILGSSTITGVVVNAQTGKPIQDANIRILSSDMGDASDIDGSFLITFEMDGDYTVIASAIGFEIKKKEILSKGIEVINIRFELLPAVIQLDPVMVLKERSSVVGLGHNFLRIPGSATIVTQKDLEKYNDSDINRIVARIPGVYVQEEDGFGLRPNIGMRGTGVERSSKINIMEDGIPIAPAPYASPAAYYSPTAGRMESFEVRKGSSQIKYGPHTTGGALNYVSTSIPEDFRVKAKLWGGQYNTIKTHVNVGGSSETFGYLMETYIDKTNGFKILDHSGNNTGYRKSDYLTKIRFNTPRSFSIPAALEAKYSVTDELSNETYLGLSRSDFVTNPLRRYAASGIDKMDADHSQTVLTAVIKPLNNMDITAAYYKNNFDRNWYKLSKAGESSIGSILIDGNNHPSYSLLSAENTDDDVYQIKANNRMYESKGIQFVANGHFSILNTSHNIMVGFRNHSDEMDRFQKVDKYGMNFKKLVMTTEGIWGTGSKNNRFYLADAKSYFIEDVFEIGVMRFTLGVRAEDLTVTRKEWKGDVSGGKGAWNDPLRTLPPSIKSKKISAIVPGAGLTWNLSSSLSLMGGIHKGFSPPGPGVDEEDEVKPEESINLEIGLRYNSGLTSFESIIFNNNYENLLGDDTQFSGTGTYDQFNAGKVNIKGLELAASHIFRMDNKKIPIHLSYTFTSTEFLSNFESSFEPWGIVSAGYELPYVPNHQLFSEVGLESKLLSYYFRFRQIGSMRTVAGSGEIDPIFSTDDVSLLDFSADYAITTSNSFFVSIYNIFNNSSVVAARPAGVRSTMPRNIIAGIKIKL